MSTEVIVAFITGILGPILIMYVKHLLDKRKSKPDAIQETLKVGELVMNKNRTHKR
jgi:capsular polysaccharide biosynthesis protein